MLATLPSLEETAMTARHLVSSGSPLEPEIGFSRAVPATAT
jgi:hypothetical protein